MWVLCIVRWTSLRRADHSSKGVVPKVVCLIVIVKLQWWGGFSPLGGPLLHEKRIELLSLYRCTVHFLESFNPFTPNDPYSGRTAPLTSKRSILYIYSTNVGTEYFKYGIYSPFFSLKNAVYFIILTHLVPVLFTFYIQGVLKFKKIIPAPKV